MNCEILELSDVAEVFNGKTPSKAEQRSVGFPVLKIRDVDDSGTFIGRFSSFVEPALAAKHPTKQVNTGDTLILNAAHNAAYVGSKTFLASGRVQGALATGEWLVIRPNEKAAHPKYVFYWSQTSTAKKHIRNAVKGIHLYPKDVAAFPIQLPQLPEQKRIAAILERADRLRRTRRYARQLSDTFLQSVFIDMFAGKESREWAQETIEDLADDKPNAIRTGPFGSQLLHSEFVNEGVAVLGIDNAVQNCFAWAKPRFITTQKYAELKRYTVSPGDVLITLMGTCGRCAVVPDEIPLAINTKHLCCISLNQTRCLPTYLHGCFLNHPQVLKRLGISERGAVMPGLNMQLIKELAVTVPPLPLQQKFAAIVLRFEHLRAQQREAERQAEHLFQTLLHRAFNGSHEL